MTAIRHMCIRTLTGYDSQVESVLQLVSMSPNSSCLRNERLLVLCLLIFFLALWVRGLCRRFPLDCAPHVRSRLSFGRYAYISEAKTADGLH